MKRVLILTTLASALCVSAHAIAAVSAEEAKELGHKLTEFGAEKAGNADGSIPPYTGGVKDLAIPADFKPGSGRYPDPFKDEKPLESITKANQAQYAKYLMPGTKALLDRLPGFRIDVYKTHRTMAYPDWVLKNTVGCARTAKLVGSVTGDGVEGAFACIPFPIPKNGYEVMWNQNLRYQGVRTDFRFRTILIDESGHKTLMGDNETQFIYQYYDRNSSKLPDNFFRTGFARFYGPPSEVGMMTLAKYSINYGAADDTTWIYMPGQRRVRVAPEYKYDTPMAAIGGTLLFDEIGGFQGRMDRFDFKLVGKKEMFVPYNNYRAYNSPNLVGDKYANPDDVRWEKHRVWVVEATLKPGERNIYSHRTYYIDEDTWLIVGYEAYDQSNALYRVGYTLDIVPYDKPRVGQPNAIMYDLTKGNYSVTADQGTPSQHMIPFDDLPNMGNYNTQALLNAGVR
ncbi:DUF1329 domain-containing protein [Burkholderia multivorans]|uniref:DUF1329 domain-containing protein n=1 Tax=Burkholderia multivorans TaxID=87883 RepID=UPI0015E2B052|nr:DUF1329 domain-containing protein [Burkholderia multivorans]MBU9312526.1 DUF1329 domain-containing protein [Burkholderia multivorans]MCA8250700.1 DUF1329 domain-containing protein [Burkholderia multivorans]MCA8457345.1 DUF1329 domain-containing protein [Burkholderia multivorans]MDN7870373.1 DUF1329 domain-containing protein [Burkholderia multivorans]